MKYNLRSLLCLVLWVNTQSHAGEQDHLFDLSIESLFQAQITTLSRYEELRDLAPGSVYVVSSEMIKRRGYTSLKDALQILPGFDVFMKDLGYVGNVRGLAANDNEKFTLMLNGFEINQVNEPEFLNGPINLDNVERIEVIVGPSSIFKPANTLVATINVISKKVNNWSLTTAAGTEREHSLTLMGGQQGQGGNGLSISATVEKRRGFDAWDSDFSTSPMSGTAGQSLTGGSVGMDHLVQLQGKYDQWSGQLFSYRTLFPEIRLNGNGLANSNYLDQMMGGQLAHQFQFNPKLTTTFNLSVVRKQSIRHASGSPWQSISQIDHNADIGLLYDQLDIHKVQAGIQLVYEDHFDSYFHDIGHPQRSFYQHSTHGYGLYLDDIMQLSKKLKLVAGIRLDHNTLIDKNWLWAGRSAIVYQASERWISKLFFNRAVRLPSPLAALNRIWGKGKTDAPIWAIGSPNAQRPELLQTLEWGNILTWQQTRLDLNFYYQDLKDFITWGAPHTNIGDFNGWGSEVTLNHSWDHNEQFWGVLAYSDAHFVNDDNFDTVTNAGDAHRVSNPDQRMIGAPRLTGAMGVDLVLRDDILFSSQLRYFSKQAAEVTADGGNSFHFEPINHQFYLDASVLFKGIIASKTDIRVSAKNILNRQQAVAGPTLSGQYRPRGRSIEVAAYFEF